MILFHKEKAVVRRKVRVKIYEALIFYRVGAYNWDGNAYALG